MTYIPVSVPRTPNGGVTKPKLKVLIGRMRDVITWPEPDPKGINVVGDIILTDAAKLINVEVTPSTIAVSQPSEGDPDNKGHKPKIEMSRPGGLDLPFEEFVENNLNEDLFAIIQYIGGKNKVAGYPGNPLQMSVESTDNNEGDTSKITLEATLRGRRMAIYTGQIPSVEGETVGSAGGA